MASASARRKQSLAVSARLMAAKLRSTLEPKPGLTLRLKSPRNKRYCDNIDLAGEVTPLRPNHVWARARQIPNPVPTLTGLIEIVWRRCMITGTLSGHWSGQQDSNLRPP